MKSERKYVIFISLILILCLIPSLGLAVFGPSDAVANELPAQKPALRSAEGEFNAEYLADLSDYVAGRFWLRPQLIAANARLTAAVFQSSASEDVVLGREGWLYYAPTLDNYLGVNGMTERELFCAARNLALMAEFCESRGMRFLFTAAPNKNSLYPEFMRYKGADAPGDADRLHELLNAGNVPYLDLFSLFNAQSEVLYFAHDSHWNERGAALAADAINAAFGRESAYFGGDFSQNARHDGDLYTMLYPEAPDPENAPSYGATLSFELTPPGALPDSIRLNTASGGEGKLFAYRDSFGNLLYPYLADSFGSAVFSRSTSYDLSQAEALGADCVLIELVERNLRYLISYTPVFPAPSRQAPEAKPSGGVELNSAAAVSPKGFVRVSGTLPMDADTDSPVYIRCSGGDYEALLLMDNAFSASLPESEAPLAVIFSSGGEWLSCTA